MCRQPHAPIKKNIDEEKAGGKEKGKIMGERLEKVSDSLMGLLMK